MFYYLVQFEWNAADNCYQWPSGVRGGVDLANLESQSTPGLSVRPVGFAAAPAALSSDFTFLGSGDLREITTDAAIRSAWRSVTGVNVNGATLIDLLWNHLTSGSDPTGADTCPPLVPTFQGDLELWLPGHSIIKSERFRWGTHGHTNRLKALLQLELVKMRQQSHEGKFNGPQGIDFEFHRRIAQSYCEKFGIDFEDLRPPSWPANERPLPHQTSYTENFTRADGDTIGNLLTWNELTGDFDTVSNKAELVIEGSANNRSCRAEHDLSGSDNYAQADVTWKQTNSVRGGVCARYQSGANTCYLASGRASNDAREIGKIVAGTFTSLDSQAQTIGAETLLVKCTANGSTISAAAGASSGSITDTSIASGTRGGLFGLTSTVAGRETQYDNFEMADLSTTGVLAGTSDMVFSGTNTLTGSGALAGTCALAFTGTNTLAGSGALAGTAAMTFGGAGVLLGSGELNGTSDLTFAGTNTLSGSGALRGTCDIVFTATALPNLPTGVITGTTALTFGGTSTLRGTGALVGLSEIDFSPSGEVTGLAPITGTSALVFGGTNPLTGQGSLVGASAMAFAVTGTTVAGGQLAGTCAMVFTCLLDSSNIITLTIPGVELRLPNNRLEFQLQV